MPRFFFKRGIQLPNSDLIGAIVPVPMPESHSEEARQNTEMEAWGNLLRHAIEILGDQKISLNRLRILLIQRPDGPFGDRKDSGQLRPAKISDHPPEKNLFPGHIGRLTPCLR